MPSYSARLDALALKVITVIPSNQGTELDSHQGAVLYFEGEHGSLKAVLDASAVTAIRTAAVSGLATRLVARPDASDLAILGAGVQGRSHLAAFPRTRDFKEIRIASRNVATAEALAAENPRAKPVATFKEAVQGADVVCCCTDAREPVLKYEWLVSGAHVSSVGGTFGPELDAKTIGAGTIFVESRDAVRQPPPAGAHELQGLRPESVTEIGEVIAATQPGRSAPDQLTVYKSSGHAVEDAAAARLVYERALAEGAGQRVSL